MPSGPGPRAPHIRQAAGAPPSRARPRAQRRSSAETPTPERSPRAPACTRTQCTGDVQHQPMRPFSVHSTIAYTAFIASLTTIRTTARVRSACGRCSSSPAPSYDDRDGAPPLSRAIVDAGAPPHARRPAFAHWEPDARRHWHVQCSTPSASETPRSNRRGCATSLRGAATCTSAIRHLPPRYEPAVTRLRHYLMRAIALPTLYRTDTLDTTPARTPARIHTPSPRPHVTFVSSALCDRLPPSPLDGRACRVLQYHPQHVPRLQRAPRSFLIAGAVFVALSYATTNYSPAAAALHRARRIRRLPARPAHPQRRPNPPLKTCPSTHHEHDEHAMHVAYPCPATVFSAAPPSAQRQVLSRSASMPRTPSVRSTRCSCSPLPTPFRPVPARTHHPQRRSALPVRLTACTYLGTVSSTTCVRHGHSPPSLLRPWHPTTVQILSAVLPPNTRASCRQRQRPRIALHALTTSILSASKRPSARESTTIPLCSLSECAAAPAAILP
ncbi:hypothetical protein DFH08DRAFT_1025653 [Mycena albidolilacea]|uniref:Uncharacterized protein n=1 Tax=Mycena albidolilacea TaxID=1033008 RepID=A0AAD7F2M8_9AGAR|nr:hypothetical protein DFH08DRAFT_1025653 [Mycena albidolilacea]